MSRPEICLRCGGGLSAGVRYCPSCGHLVSADRANSFDRFCSAVVDASIWLGCSALLVWFGLGWWVILPVWIVLTEFGYQLQGSVGKSVVGLAVPVKGRYQHYFRETIGKLASLATFGIGFLMVLSEEGLALHDYMAGTRVLRVRKAARTLEGAITLFLLLGIASGGYFLIRPKTQKQPSMSFSERQTPTLDAIVSRMPAVATLYVYNSRGKSVGQGSGFLLSSDGVGVTNFHVIKDAYSAEAKLGDGRLYSVLRIQAYDPERDIAVFQLGRKSGNGTEEAADLPFLTLAADEAQVGDRIATLGSPEGLANSVSDGLVSAIRTAGGQRYLQITAPISPGSSGGPVLNLKGEVVAISTFQMTEGQNLNFAIPADAIAGTQARQSNLPLEQLYWQLRLSPPESSRTGAQDKEEREAEGLRRDVLLTGSFGGTVHNLTVDLQAKFGILVEETEGTIIGCMGVQKPLYGSGPLLGSVDGKLVRFDVSNPAFQIHFEGTRTWRSLSGTYHVTSAEGGEQFGEFILRRTGSEKLSLNFDPHRDCPTDEIMNR